MGIDTGNSLNEFFIFCGFSAFPYIRSRYTLDTDILLPDYLNNNMLYWDKGFVPIVRNLAEITRDNTHLLSRNGFYLYLPEKPESGSYNFKISVKFGDTVLFCEIEY
ncbi:MAG: hypothetical protein LIP08_05490, partial [Bacteroides sp.]|nr:hypothetical protein [Bacteroides sp.]